MDNRVHDGSRRCTKRLSQLHSPTEAAFAQYAFDARRRFSFLGDNKKHRSTSGHEYALMRSNSIEIAVPAVLLRQGIQGSEACQRLRTCSSAPTVCLLKPHQLK